MSDKKMKEMDIYYHEYQQILRRRKDITKRVAAKNLKIPYHQYRQMEKGDALPKQASSCSLTLPEIVYLLRRRAGLTMKEAAKLYGVSRQIVHLYENGNKPIGIIRYEKWWRARVDG